MNKRTIFSNYVNLELYQFCVRSFQVHGHYHFDYDYVDGVASYDPLEILRQLNFPYELAIEDQRALLLAFAGTEFETEDLCKLALSTIRYKDDVFIAVAASFLKDGKYRNLMQRFLLTFSQNTIEEEIFTILAFDEPEYDILPILRRISDKLRFHPSIVFGNPKMMKKLFEFNSGDTSSELISSLEKAVKCIPNKDSATMNELLSSGFRAIDVYAIAYYLRSNVGIYKYSGKKIERAKTLLKNSIAGAVRKWTDFDKEILATLNGNLGQRIINEKNYVWYKEIYGFSLPELDINWKDTVAVKKFIPLLSEYDKYLLLESDSIPEERKGKLSIKLKKWDPRLLPAYKGQKCAHKNYSICTQDIQTVFAEYGCGDEAYLAFKYSEQAIPYEYQIPFAEYLKGISYTEWIEYVQDYELYEDLNSDDFDLYTQINCFYNPEIVRGYENRIGDFTYFVDLLYPSLEDDKLLTWVKEHKSIDYNKAEAVRRLTQICDENISKLVSLADKAMMISEGTLLTWRDYGCLLECIEKYKPNIGTTVNYSALFNNYYFKEFKNWIGLSMRDCFIHYDALENFSKHMYVINGCYARSYKFKYCMVEPYRRYILGGDVNHLLSEFHSLHSLIGEDSEWDDEWLRLVKKDFLTVSSMSSFDMNFGKVNGVDALYTSIGIIAAEPIDNLTIPVYVIDDEDGEATDVFIGAPMEGEITLPVINKISYRDQIHTLFLKRVN